jgi:DNA-binding beta-propeller fold protein YncE
VYVTDTGNKRVVIFDPSGKYIRQISSGLGTAGKIAPQYPFNQPGEMNEPMGLAVDSQGNVYVADRDNKRIQKFDNAGKFVTQWPMTGTNWESGPYVEPFLETDAEGNLYVSAPTAKTVLKYSPTGELLGQKNREGAITLQTPTGLVVAPDGKVYVVDTGQHGVVNMGTVP